MTPLDVDDRLLEKGDACEVIANANHPQIGGYFDNGGPRWVTCYDFHLAEAQTPLGWVPIGMYADIQWGFIDCRCLRKIQPLDDMDDLDTEKDKSEPVLIEIEIDGKLKEIDIELLKKAIVLDSLTAFNDELSAREKHVSQWDDPEHDWIEPN